MTEDRPVLMCAVSELEPGWRVGASVSHPRRPQTQLLAPNTELTPSIIGTLDRLDVDRVWVTNDFVDDYDMGASRSLSREQRALFDALQDDFAGRAKTTITHANMNTYKQRIGELMLSAISNRKYASFASRMRSDEGGLFAHAASVAYLCVVCGLELEPYIMRERARLSPDKAVDHGSLGLAGLLHDVGKTNCDFEVREQHEVHLTDGDDHEAYRDHVQVGYRMLEFAEAPASVRVAVRMHHQRWDGSGWPDPSDCGVAEGKVIEGRSIHIFSRIVAAANVLDNLLRRADGTRRVAVCALHEFASERFDGWLDPRVRHTLLKAVQPFAVGSRVVLSDRRPCAVAAPNPSHPCLPQVRPLEADAPIIDLSNDPDERRIVLHDGRDVSGLLYEPTPAPRFDDDEDEGTSMLPQPQAA